MMSILAPEKQNLGFYCQKSCGEGCTGNVKLADKPLVWGEFLRCVWSKLRVISNDSPSADSRNSVPGKSQASAKNGLCEGLNKGALELGDENFRKIGSDAEENSQQIFYKKLKFKVNSETEFRFRKFHKHGKLIKNMKENVLFLIATSRLTSSIILIDLRLIIRMNGLCLCVGNII